MKPKGKKRLDELLVHLGLCESRSQAKALILAGKIWNGTERLDKASRLCPLDLEIRLESPPKYVGRGGLKLENFLEKTKINPTGLKILDLGASTGGFTDCLLQKGAKEATCIDVGHGQLHYKLRSDPRVKNFEKLNLRHLRPEDLNNLLFPLVVMDLSFISLKKVLNNAWLFVEEGGRLISLIKPQFECTQKEASEGKGVIRSHEIQLRVKEEILDFAKENLPEASQEYLTEAKPMGTDGNVEFFVSWRKQMSSKVG